MVRKKYVFGAKAPRAPKVGIVVTIRISPPDVMSVIDMVDKIDLYTPGMSFSQATSIALRATMEALRHNNVLPTRDGFEFADMIARFPTEAADLDRIRGKQIKITEAFELGRGGENGRITELSRMVDRQPPTEEELKVDPETHPNPEVRRIYHRLQEMDAKKVVDPDNFDNAEYDELQRRICRLI